MRRVLLLNSSFEPLRLVPIQRAIGLLFGGKAELVETAGQPLRSAQRSYEAPLVIRLIRYVVIPHRHRLPCTRRGVLARDGERCQYCGASPGREALTLDHVIPRSRGGQSGWENLVTACKPCNQRKADRTPEQAGMSLRARPRRPLGALMLYRELEQHPVWAKYVMA